MNCYTDNTPNSIAGSSLYSLKIDSSHILWWKTNEGQSERVIKGRIGQRERESVRAGDVYTTMSKHNVYHEAC